MNGEVGPYVVQGIINAFRPSWKEDEEYDKPFFEVVAFMRTFLIRKIKKAKDGIEAESFIRKAYEEAQDKRVIIFDGYYPWRRFLLEYPEPLYVVCPKSDKWNVYCVPKEKESFDNRKSLPEAWAGLRDDELAKVTGVPDAVFCHNGRFLAVAKSKEGALELARKALEN
ncbi:MYG1 family protein [Candidatus Nomurabacteria bacterium]|nr:MYG1 family protein [Candidatus Nomurabacteria bacterium]